METPTSHPSSLQTDVLSELHQGHLEINKMKNVARMMVWFPKLDEEIEKTVKRCSLCQSSRPEASEAPVHLWEFLETPWHQLHIDFLVQSVDIIG